MPILQGADGPIEYVRRKGRTSQKNVVISIREGVVLVSAPLRASEKAVADIVQQKLPWITEMLEKQKLTTLSHAESKPLFLESIDYQGSRLPMAYSVHPHSGWKTDPQPGKLMLHYPASLKIIEIERTIPTEQSCTPEDHVSLDVKKAGSSVAVHWLQSMALAYFPNRLCTLANTHGFPVHRVTLRAQKGRWGSCSSRHGNISLNWRLIQAPTAVSDYVLYHELAHLREPHHQPPFWSLVRAMMPDYEIHKEWLRVHGASLFQVDAFV